jgi:hypothetical protein
MERTAPELWQHSLEDADQRRAPVRSGAGDCAVDFDLETLDYCKAWNY